MSDSDQAEPAKPAAEPPATATLEESPNDEPPSDEPAPAPEPVPETDDPLFNALWAKVLAAWDDNTVHSAILEYSVTCERLPDLAGHYRALKDDPEKGERAKKRLDAIVIAATQLMMSMKTPANVTVPLSITLTVLALCVVVVVFLAYTMFHRQ